jgi:heme-degrading monooxygenase HmoA
MPVQSVVRLPRLSREDYDASAQQLGALVVQQPGFISHAAVQDGEGFIVTEYWDAEDQARQWYDTTVRPATQQAGIADVTVEFHPVHNLIRR